MILLCLFCTACSADAELSPAVEFRSELVSSGGAEFSAEVLADFGETVQTFCMDCRCDEVGNLSFTVTSPETLSGITATVTDSGGTITYDGMAMDFGLLANGNVIPAAAPAIVCACWIDGYISSAGSENDAYRVTYEKNFDEKALTVDTWFEKNIPICAEVCYNNERILSITIRDFSFS